MSVEGVRGVLRSMWTEAPEADRAKVIERFASFMEEQCRQEEDGAERRIVAESSSPVSGRCIAYEDTLGDQARWGDWVEIDGKEYRRAFPPGTAVRGAPTYYADAEGNWYVRPILPGVKLKAAEKPEWAPTEGPGTPEDDPTTDPLSFSWGEWKTIDGKDYREVFPPEPLRRSGRSFFVDEDGNWYRGKSVPLDGSKEERIELTSIDAPNWFDGWTSELPTDILEDLNGLRQIFGTYFGGMSGFSSETGQRSS